MIYAADYPLLDILVTMVFFFAWVIWIWTLVIILSDVFRRGDLSGWAKAGWTLLTIALPFVGVLTYLILHGREIGERRIGGLGGPVTYDRPASPPAGNGAAAEIADAKRLLDTGAIDEAEFAQIKRRVLA